MRHTKKHKGKTVRDKIIFIRIDFLMPYIKKCIFAILLICILILYYEKIYIPCHHHYNRNAGFLVCTRE